VRRKRRSRSRVMGLAGQEYRWSVPGALLRVHIGVAVNGAQRPGAPPVSFASPLVSRVDRLSLCTPL
jgi:hypothetical protein